MPNRAWTLQDEQLLIELRAEGLTWRAIAARLERSEASVAGRHKKLQCSEK
jgi:DNA-binding NarL/FixJ family response regulator